MESIKEWGIHYKRNLLFVLMAILLLMFVCLFVKLEIWDGIPEYATHIGNRDDEQFIYNFEEDVVIQQEFTCDRPFDFITLSFSDHDQTIQGKTIIQIDEKATGEKIYYGEIENSSIHYGEYVKIFLESGGQAGKTYLLTLYETDTEGTLLGIFGYLAEEGKGALVNGMRSEYAVSLGMHTETNLFKKLVVFITVLLIIMLLLCLGATWKRGGKEENLFLCIALPLGAAFLCLLSINPVHDGATHLAKVYQYSNMLLGWDKSALGRSGYVYLKEDEKECFDSLYQENFSENEQAQISWEIYEDFGDNTTNTPLLKSHEYRETATSSVWEYFPGILGMTLGRLLGVSARANLLLTKIFFFLFYVAACYYAIRTAPRFKTGIAFTALLPMALYQATGITYDSVVIAVMMMIIALWLKARENPLLKREWFYLIALAYIIGCCKGGFYSVVLFLFFIVPAINMGGKKKKALLIFCLLGTAAVAVLITSFRVYLPYLQGVFEIQAAGAALEEPTQKGTITDNQIIVELIPEKGTISYGVMYIVREPLQCAKLIFHTLWNRMDYYMGSLIGYRMAWSDRTTPWFIVVAFYILLCMGILETSEKKNGVLRLKERIGCAILIGMEIVAFHLLMLIETPIGNKVINGVQGRYFIAWIPVILMLCSDKIAMVKTSSIRKIFLLYGFVEVMYFLYFLIIFFNIN